MLKTYFLSLSIFLTIYITTFNVLFFKRKNNWSKNRILILKLIYCITWNCLFGFYSYLVCHTPYIFSNFLIEYLVLGAALHVFATIYGYKVTFE